MSEKTEKPTAKKIRDARNKGQVANSKEIVSAAMISAIFLLLWSMADIFLLKLGELITTPTIFYQLPFNQALQHVFDHLLHISVFLLAPIFGVAIIVAIFSNYLQVGNLFVFEPIKPTLEKVSPVSGFKKIFSMKNLFEFFKSIVKIVFLSLLIYLVIRNNLQAMINLSFCGESCLSRFIGHLFFMLMIYTIAAFIIIAILDLIFQKAQHIKQLKMSKDEIKREYKDTEGNPEIKSRRKQIHRETMANNMPDQVRKSNVIVTNPTHVAIGLYYDKATTPLPKVTIKGVDHVAKHIKAIAKDADIPIMENVPLARALLAHSDIGHYIPDTLIEPVAEVMKWVHQLNKKSALSNTPSEYS